MAILNLRKANPWSILGILIISSMVAACGSPTSVRGIILDSTGKPFAEKKMILVGLLPGDQVAITSLRAGGPMSMVVPLIEWKPSSDDIVYERGYGGTPKWGASTNAAGEFTIRSVTPGKYVLLWLGSSNNVYPIGANGEFIRLEVQEGQTNDLGSLTLMNFSEPILK
jgi:hypothetical protein